MEIERKFLIGASATEHIRTSSGLVGPIEAYLIDQLYLSVNPEVRIRREYLAGGATQNLTIKSDGSLSRQEVIIPLSMLQYRELSSLVKGLPITKVGYTYMLLSGHRVYVFDVDPELPSKFTYAEVEFKSEEQALAFKPPSNFGREVTDDPYYKMKNYWRKTRLNHTPYPPYTPYHIDELHGKELRMFVASDTSNVIGDMSATMLVGVDTSTEEKYVLKVSYEPRGR